MNEQSLRIGNLVFNNDDKIVKADLEILERISKKNLFPYSIWNYTPVKLTEELLFKLNFEYFESNNSYQLDSGLGFNIWGRIGEGFYVYVNSDEIGDKMEYVHQIQNVCFALTGEELTLKT